MRSCSSTRPTSTSAPSSAGTCDARESLEAANPSFVDGTTNGGERIQAQLGYFRPFPGYAHYRSPVRNLYMTGPHCHPGGGISGAGSITARVLLEDQGIRAS